MILISFWNTTGRTYNWNPVLHASDGIIQSPRGERPTDPTFGPSGMHERLNCWLKNLLQKVFSHFSIVSQSYTPSNAFVARKRIFSALYPKRMKL